MCRIKCFRGFCLRLCCDLSSLSFACCLFVACFSPLEYLFFFRNELAAEENSTIWTKNILMFPVVLVLWLLETTFLLFGRLCLLLHMWEFKVSHSVLWIFSKIRVSKWNRKNVAGFKFLPSYLSSTKGSNSVSHLPFADIHRNSFYISWKLHTRCMNRSTVISLECNEKQTNDVDRLTSLKYVKIYTTHSSQWTNQIGTIIIFQFQPAL